ncbi:MAG: hypothetical protein E7676_02155 [Ruminococcaceae bacterium]|nr:hypothetical protein [Oscillospiraceae bacterium]
MKNRFLTIFVGIFLAIVLVFGGVLGIVVGVKNAKAVVKYGNVMIDEETANYLVSYYKMLYLKELNLSGIAVSDRESFWESEADDGKSYAEHFKTAVREYIASVVVAADIYLTHSTYTPDDKLSVALTCEEILKYKAQGDVSLFNEKCEKYGFTYEDFSNAAALLYKAQRAEVILYGEEGENLKNFPEECEKYFSTYSHVSLLFLRDETLVATDAEGNYVKDDEGNVVFRDMTESERAEREALAEEIRGKISAGSMSADEFEGYLARSDSDEQMSESGYYFNPSATTTALFAESYAEVVDSALDMQIGEYREVDTSVGVCFIYKYERTEAAYADTDNPFFSDFYADAVPYLYGEVLAELTPNVKFKDAYEDIDVVAIPMIEEFYIREFKSAKK